MHLIDMHCDTAAKLLDSKNGEGLYENSFDIDIRGMKKAGTLAQFFACFVYMEMFQGQDRLDQAFSYAKKMADNLKKELKVNEGMIALAGNAADILRNKEEGKISAILTLEEGGILNGEMERLEELYREGTRLVTLLWNFENCMGYPNSTDAKIMEQGLKPFGFETVERMNELGMIVDVSHMSDGGFWDVLRHSKAPVVASHSSARSLCRHPRNLTDEMLRALGENGGVAAVNFYPAFIREDGKASKEDLAAHIKHMVNVAGIDAVAIGTDYDGFEGGTLEIDRVGKMPLLYEELQKEGFTEEQVEKIWFRNSLRVIQDVMK